MSTNPQHAPAGVQTVWAVVRPDGHVREFHLDRLTAVHRQYPDEELRQMALLPLGDPRLTPEAGWMPMDSAPRSGARILGLIPCYGDYRERGQLRGYLEAVVSWARNVEGEGFWHTGYGDGRKEIVLWMPLPRRPLPPPPAPETKA